MIRDFGDKTKEVLDIWSRIKGDNLGVGITILIFIVVALMSGWMIFIVNEKKEGASCITTHLRLS